MAKNFVNLSDLTTFKGLYDTQVADAIATASAKSLKTVAISGQTLNFYREEEPVGAATPAYSITLPQADLSGLIPKISGATGSKVAQTKADGTIEEASLAVADIATKTYADTAASTAADGKDAAIQAAQDAADAAQGDVDALETLVGTIPAGAEASTVVAYAAEVAATAEADAEDYADGLVGALATVATTGAASDVSYSNTTSSLTATNVQAAIDELAEASAGGVDSKTVYITQTSGQSSDPFSKRYGVYQGSTGSAASPVPAEKLVDIDIPKDMVVEEGSVVDITYSDGHLYDGAVDVTEIIKGEGGTATAADAGKYIKLEIANANSSVLYIAAQDLVDIYTGGTNDDAQVIITNNNEILVSVRKLDAAKIIYQYADEQQGLSEINIKSKVDAVEAKVDAIDVDGDIDAALADLDASITQQAGTDGLSLSITEVDGVITSLSGSIASGTYDASGSAAAVLGTSSDTSTDNTVYGAKALANDLYDDISNVGDTAIQALFA